MNNFKYFFSRCVRYSIFFILTFFLSGCGGITTIKSDSFDKVIHRTIPIQKEKRITYRKDNIIKRYLAYHKDDPEIKSKILSRFSRAPSSIDAGVYTEEIKHELFSNVRYAIYDAIRDRLQEYYKHKNAWSHKNIPSKDYVNVVYKQTSLNKGLATVIITSAWKGYARSSLKINIQSTFNINKEKGELSVALKIVDVNLKKPLAMGIKAVAEIKFNSNKFMDVLKDFDKHYTRTIMKHPYYKYTSIIDNDIIEINHERHDAKKKQAQVEKRLKQRELYEKNKERTEKLRRANHKRQRALEDQLLREYGD